MIGGFGVTGVAFGSSGIRAANMTKLCRGVRGATTADGNTREDILTASIQLLALLIRLNDIDPEDVSSAIFTVTRDLNAEFPALAARQLGWSHVPLLCSYEIDVPGFSGPLHPHVGELEHGEEPERDRPRLHQAGQATAA
jgi:monofunctional chorismate mutase